MSRTVLSTRHFWWRLKSSRRSNKTCRSSRTKSSLTSCRSSSASRINHQSVSSPIYRSPALHLKPTPCTQAKSEGHQRQPCRRTLLFKRTKSISLTRISRMLTKARSNSCARRSRPASSAQSSAFGLRSIRSTSRLSLSFSPPTCAASWETNALTWRFLMPTLKRFFILIHELFVAFVYIKLLFGLEANYDKQNWRPSPL